MSGGGVLSRVLEHRSHFTIYDTQVSNSSSNDEAVNVDLMDS